MDKLNKDEIVTIALLLDFPDILNMCKVSQKFNHSICQNNDFWRSKVLQKFPEVNITDSDVYNWQEFYIEYSLSKLPLESYKVPDPQYIKPEFVDFLLEADFGIIPKTDIPMKYLLALVVKQKILTHKIASDLLEYYLEKNGLDTFFKKHLEKYMVKAERNLYRFSKNLLHFVRYLFEPKTKFRKQFKKEIYNTLSKISYINKNRI